MTKETDLTGVSERELLRVSPHPLAFFSQMVLWIYIIIVTSVAWIYSDQIVGMTKNIPLIGGFVADYSIYFVIALLVVIPTLIYSVLKITWRYFIVAFLLTVVLPIAFPIAGIPQWYTIPVIIGVSILALIAIQLHRRAHKYIITDRRIIFEYNGLFKKIRRDIVYSRVSDIVLEKGILGKIFNYGSIIPISKSSMGMGADLAAVTGGAAGGKGLAVGVAVTGGRTVYVPRSRSQYVLYAVPNPEKIYDIISNALKMSEEAPYLKKIIEKLDEKKQ